MRMQLEDQPHVDGRIVVLDTTRNPAQVLVSCLACNRLTDELECKGIMCPEWEGMMGPRCDEIFERN